MKLTIFENKDRPFRRLIEKDKFFLILTKMKNENFFAFDLQVTKMRQIWNTSY